MLATYNDNIPVYQQIVDYIEEQIISSEVAEGERVPSVRELGEKLAVNPNTCVKAYEILIEQGVIETRRGTGSWVLAGAVERIIAKKQTEFRTKTLPYLVSTMKRYGITKEQLTDSINELYNA